MILDEIDRLARYESVHPLFAEAAKFLGRADLAALPDGRHELRGDALYATIMRGEGKLPEEAQLEVHNAYIDIQVILQGPETMGWKPRSGCLSPVDDYDPELDFLLYQDTPDAWVTVQAGQFVVFFPEDAHAPMVAKGALHKVVIKVAR